MKGKYPLFDIVVYPISIIAKHYRLPSDTNIFCENNRTNQSLLGDTWGTL